jgi:hypothetical protein
MTRRARRLQSAVNAEQVLKMLMWKPTCLRDREGSYRWGRERDEHPTFQRSNRHLATLFRGSSRLFGC